MGGNRKFKKFMGLFLAIMMIFSLGLTSLPQSAVAAKLTGPQPGDITIDHNPGSSNNNGADIGLIVSGTGVSQDLYFTYSQLAAMAAGNNNDYPLVGRIFSVLDKHGTDTSAGITVAQGIDLDNLLTKAGASGVEQIKLTCTDGFESTLTELNSKTRYYYPGIFTNSEANKVAVKPLLSFYNKNYAASDMPVAATVYATVYATPVEGYFNPTIIDGQRGLAYTNKDLNAKMVQVITVGSPKYIMTLDGTGISSKKNLTMADIMLAGLEQQSYTYQKSGIATPVTDTCTGLTLKKILQKYNITDPTIQIKVKTSDNYAGESFTVGDVLNTDKRYLLATAWGTANNATPLRIYRNTGFGNTGVFKNVVGLQIGDPFGEIGTGSKLPNVYPANGADFYIYVKDSGNIYYFNYDEMLTKYSEQTHDFQYYDHNMNNGQGANRLIKAKGFDVRKIFNDLQSDAIGADWQMQIEASDGYKAENQYPVTEVDDFRYFLANQISQQTASGAEPDDTAVGVFKAAENETKFRTYCAKDSANPAVYKQTVGICLSSAAKVAVGQSGEACAYTVKYVNTAGQELKTAKKVFAMIPPTLLGGNKMQVTEKAPQFDNCVLQGEAVKTISLEAGTANEIVFTYAESPCFFMQQQDNKTGYKLSELRANTSKTNKTYPDATKDAWAWKYSYEGIPLNSLLAASGENDLIAVAANGSKTVLDKSKLDKYFIAYQETKKKAQGKLTVVTVYPQPSLLLFDQDAAKESQKLDGIAGIVAGVNFISGNDATVTVTNTPTIVMVPAGALGTMLQLSPGAELPHTEIQAESSLGTIKMDIPQGTKMTGPSGWTGKLSMPTVKSAPSVAITGAPTVNAVVMVGLDNQKITLDKAVRLVLPGQTGKKTGFICEGKFAEISTILNEDSQTKADQLPAGSEAIFDNGTDMIIWTKHFTEFVAYTPVTVILPGGGGGGGGGGIAAPSGQLAGINGATLTKEGATVVIPANAVNSDIHVEVSKINASGLATATGQTIISDVYEISKDKSDNFSKDVTVTLPFDKSKTDKDKDTLNICFWDGSKWAALTNTKVDWSAATVSGTVNHFTKFAVLAQKASQTTAPVTSQPATSSVILADINGHWAEAAIRSLVGTGILSGYPDGTFKPDQTISRAEFTVMLVKAFKLPATGNKVFYDTKQHWAQAFIAAASDAGIVSGYDSNTFKPDARITREQMAVMVAKAAKLEKANQVSSFKDQASLSSWSREAIASAAAAQLLSGYPDQTFRPGNHANRAEAASVIAKASQRK